MVSQGSQRSVGVRRGGSFEAAGHRGQARSKTRYSNLRPDRLHATVTNSIGSKAITQHADITNLTFPSAAQDSSEMYRPELYYTPHRSPHTTQITTTHDVHPSTTTTTTRQPLTLVVKENLSYDHRTTELRYLRLGS